MTSIKPKIYDSHSKLVCDWTDKTRCLVHYRLLKFYVKHGMVIEEVHDVTSFKQSKWLEKYINFNTQKRKLAVKDYENEFKKFFNKAFYVQTMENVRNRCKIKILKKIEIDKTRKQQSKLTFDGIHKSYENCDSSLFKENEVTMDKPIYLGFAVLELSKLLMYETYYDKLQPYFGEKNYTISLYGYR